MEKLNEIIASDQFGGEWTTFVKKYRKFKKDTSLFVQFTDYKHGDKLDKAPHGDPNHADPIGVYAYPLEYVLNFPGDIWYGANMHYIRILKERFPQKTLTLSYITDSSTATRLLKKALEGEDSNPYHAYSRAESLLQVRYKSEKHKISWQELLPARAFFYAIQHDMSKSLEDNHYEVVSGKTQTDRLRKTGMYAIQDVAKKDTSAIINNREPEQIVFLYNQAFEVMDTYKLTNKVSKEPYSNPLTTNSIKGTRFVRKIIALTAHLLGEKLLPNQTGTVPSIRYSSAAVINTFYTKEGTAIYIEEKDASLASRIKNTKIGQKLHRIHKENPHYFYITITNEKGSVSSSVGADSNIEEDIQDLVARLNDSSIEKDPGKFRSPQIDAEDYDTAQSEYYNKEAQKKQQEYLDRFPDIYEAYQTACTLLGITPIIPEDKAKFVESIEGAFRLLYRGLYSDNQYLRTSIPEDKQKIDETINHLQEYFNTEEEPRKTYLYSALNLVITFITITGYISKNFLSNIYWFRRELEEYKEKSSITENILRLLNM